MRRTIGVVAAVALVALLVGVAFAQMGPGMMGPGMGWNQMGPYGYPGMMGPGMGWGQMGPGQMGPGQMGPGMMGGYGCAMGYGAGSGPGVAGSAVTEDQAKQEAQQYADKYLKGFTVDKVLPFTGMGMAMYSVELKGPQGEIRTLHVNPWGAVMPYGGPWRRG